MRRVCFCGFLETREHSSICNCHLQLIIARYILHINNVTYYTHSSELKLSAGVNTTTGSISQGTLASLFSPKTARELYTNTKSQHASQSTSLLRQGYTAQTRTTLASNSWLQQDSQCTLWQRRKRAHKQVFEHKLVSECWQWLGQLCKDTQPQEPFWCAGMESRSKLSACKYMHTQPHAGGVS